MAEALWTEIQWLMPTDRIVTISVEGNDIEVEFGQPIGHVACMTP